MSGKWSSNKRVFRVIRYVVLPFLLLLLIGFPFAFVPLFLKEEDNDHLKQSLYYKRDKNSIFSRNEKQVPNPIRELYKYHSRNHTTRKDEDALDDSDNDKPIHRRRRVRPGTKIVYLLHIHKSGGTSLCNVAKHNKLSASKTNCNVQRDQRCCGQGDSLEAQQTYFHTSPYDFVASEGRMYSAMDTEHYSYIVILRNSQQRYFSHWKHARREYLRLPSMRHEEEQPIAAAGGNAEPKPKLLLDELDLTRESKQERQAKREAKMREIEAWKQRMGRDPLNLPPFNATKNQRRLLGGPGGPARRRHFRRQKHTDSDDEVEAMRPGVRLMPHPAEDTKYFDPNNFTTPLIGKKFAHWWMAQPDNWNFRQLCGTHCVGIPKYQLTLQDWNYTLNRLLQFDTILFLEDLQTSIHVLASRMDWNVSDLTAIREEDNRYEARRAIRREAVRRKRYDGVTASQEELEQWYRQEKQKQAEEQKRRRKDDPVAEGQLDDWDPLMSVLDDALYDIGQQFERLKLVTRKSTDQLTQQDLEPFSNTAIFSTEDLRSNFQFYMQEEPGNHRTQCQNECCAFQCSAW